MIQEATHKHKLQLTQIKLAVLLIVNKKPCVSLTERWKYFLDNILKVRDRIK
jgi:hypothetical protein